MHIKELSISVFCLFAMQSASIAAQPDPNLAREATRACEGNGSTSGAGSPCKLINAAEETVAEGVVHFTYELQVGQNEREKIRIHRVVKTRTGGAPIRTRDSVLLVHGDAWGFEPSF